MAEQIGKSYTRTVIDTPIKLGQSTSLLDGYKADVYDKHFQSSPQPALVETPIELQNPELNQLWTWPIITLHKNREDLISELFQIKLQQVKFDTDASVGGAVAQWPAGPLTLRGLTDEAHDKALQKLSDQIGIDLSVSEWSYALIRRTRTVGTVKHKSFAKGIFTNHDPQNTLDPHAFEAIKKLPKLSPKSLDVDFDGAKKYLEFTATYGSHFVSSVDIGDSLFQVFAYDQEEFNEIVKLYEDPSNNIEGPGSEAFAIFTAPKNDLGYGYSSAIGTLGITSCDPELENTIKDGLWYDDRWTKTSSIFTPYYRSDSVNANEVFKRLTVISTELTPFSVYAKLYRQKICRRIFKGAMYAKYAGGSGVAPYFSNNCPYDLDEIFKNCNDPLVDDGQLSTLATPTVSFWQELSQYSDIQLQFPELVERFSIFANAIKFDNQEEQPDPKEANDAMIMTDVPGSSTATFMSYIISVGGSQPCATPPNLKLSDTAYKEFKTERLTCGHFFGGLRVCNTGADKTNDDGAESFVVMNGLQFEYRDGKVSVVKDVRDSPPPTVVEERMTDIQFGLTAAEARLNHVLSNKTDKGALYVMQGFLNWLARILDMPNPSPELSTLRARAKYLAQVTANPYNYGLPIPYLKFDAYVDVVDNIQNVLETASGQLKDYQSQIRARKAEEREIDRLDDINQNIINSGKLLEQYINTQVEYQGQIAEMFSRVIDQKKEELDQAFTELDELTAKLDEQRDEVERCVDDYKTAVIDWLQREMIKCGLDIAMNIFTLGFTVITPSGSILALQSLGSIAQKAQKAFDIFCALIETYRSINAIPNNPQQVIDALDSAGLDGLQMPTILEWDEMKVNFDATLQADGPPNAAIPERTKLTAAFSVLVLRGKALVQTQDKVQKICADISAVQQQLDLASAQKERLKELTVNLDAKPENLDRAKIDLVGLSGQLIYFERHMLMTLLQTIVLQDRALQYEYLRPPTSIGSFTLLGLQMTILNQSQSINDGLTAQPKPEHVINPIVYEVQGVPSSKITNNNRFTFDIDLGRREFISYNYVRVEDIDVEIDGIKLTDSGKYYTELCFDGTPFYDRGFNREMRTFQTSSRYYTSLHTVENSIKRYQYTKPSARSKQKHQSSSQKRSNKESGKHNFDLVSQITPFSRWCVSLPKSPSNTGIQFDDNTVTVRLTFNIYAQLKEPSYLHASDTKKWQHSLQLLQRDMPQKQQGGLQRFTMSRGRKAGTANRKNTADVLKLMNGKSVCSGWDSVYSMTAEQVNEQLRLQYNDREGNPIFLREIGDEYPSVTSEGIQRLQKYNFVLDVPEVQFNLNNRDYCKVHMNIISGTYKNTIVVGDQEITLDDVKLSEPNTCYIKADVALTSMKGTVSSQQHVTINLNEGSFSPMNFNTVNINIIELKSALENFFMNLKDGYELYKLGTLDLSDYTGLESLVPQSFKFNVVHTPSDRDLLQLFIATTGKEQDTLHLYMPSPEPIPAEYQSSLVVNTKIFYKDVLPASIGDGGIGLEFNSTEPADDESHVKMWHSETSNGLVNVPFKETVVYDSEKIYNAPPNFTARWLQIQELVRMKNDQIPVSMRSMKFESNSNSQIRLTYETYDTYKYEYMKRKRNGDTIHGTSAWNGEWESQTLRVRVAMNNVITLAITGKGQDQGVQIVFDKSNVHCDGDIEPEGHCEASEHDVQTTFFGKFQEHVPPVLEKVFQQKFESVSIFALKNILFPGKNLIDMKVGHIPGDMVVFGNFTGD